MAPRAAAAAAFPFVALAALLCYASAVPSSPPPPLTPLVVADGPSLSCGGGGICLSGTVNHNAILQRAPARAAVVGSVGAGSPAGAAVSLLLAGTRADGSAYSKLFATSAAPDLTFKVLLDAMPARGSYSVTVSCAACAGAPTSVSVGGVTFGDVWVASGQSNMALTLFNTYERNASLAAVLAGRNANIRVWRGGLGGVGPERDGSWVLPAGPNSTNCSATGMADYVWCSGLELAQHDDNADGRSAFFDVLAVPWYWAEQLNALYASDGASEPPPPIGIMGNPIGGTMVEQWSPFAAQLGCVNQTCMCDGQCNASQPLNPANQSACAHNAELWRGQQQGLLNTTISGWLWYQGENNCGGDAGNSLFGTGYGCMLPAMVAAWRAAWSAVPGTTSPSAFFASVSLHDGGDEGDGNNAQPIRWSQTGNYGMLPSPAIPNSVIAEAYDGGDVWEGWVCYDTTAPGGTPDKLCCVPPSVPLGKDCIGDHRGQFDNSSTQFYMGTLHPRSKRVPSVRLAQQTWAALLKPSSALLATGPVISGCAVAGATLTVTFNASLLKGEHVVISRPDGSLPMSAAAENTAFYALPGNLSLPGDVDENHRFSYDVWDYHGPFSDGNELGVHGWVPLMPTATGADNAVTLDLSDPALGGVAPSAIRYAVGGSECWSGGGDPSPPKGGVCARVCTGPFQDCALQPCLTESCPIKSSNAAGKGALQLPAAPFVALIKNIKCQCLPPQVCDE